ncbi:ABC transporter permease [Ascidiimonas sp. W6]|uniref:ABC transporter permease n=1 Tax=Ascidiimonas meishanensis TaxID=3128903 RepID=UPI0030EB8AAD
MLKQHILLFFRTALKDKKSIIINILGLSAGLVCFILANVYINYLKSYDKFHENKETLYQLVKHDFNGAQFQHDFYSSYALAQTVESQLPEIKEIVSATSDYSFFVSSEEVKLKTFGKYVGENFFDIFTYKNVAGDAKNPLKDEQSIAITANLAKRLFGSTNNVIGKIVEIKGIGDFSVSSVFELPSNTYDIFDFVIPLKVFISQNPSIRNDWTENIFKTYFLVNQNTDLSKINTKITRINSENNGLEIRQKVSAVKYTDLSLGANFENGEYRGSSSETVFSIILLMAFGVLIIACINYTNMATAKALSRIKEIGIKKAVGVSRAQLVIQFLTEIFIITLIAVLLSIILVSILLPSFSNLVELPLEIKFSPVFIAFIVFMILFVTVVAGGYPAIYLSRFKLLNALRGSVKGSFTDIFVRKGLVWFQFFVSIVLIVFVLILNKQIDFILNKDLGHNIKNTLSIEASGELQKNTDTYLAELKNIPGVVNASTIYDGFYNESLYDGVEWEGKPMEKSVYFNIRRVGADFFKTTEIGIREGRNFNRTSDQPYTKAIINEEAVKRMGLSEPVGRTITFNKQKMNIVGVVKDVHLIPVFKSIEPLLFIYSNDVNNIIVKTNKASNNALAQIRALSTSFNPEYSFEYRYIEDMQLEKFKFLMSLSDLSLYLTIIAIIICFLGVYGLTAFNIERRKREIGIKKALSSGNVRIFKSLTFDLVKIICVALVVGLTLSYFILDSVLQVSFSYRIDLKLWYFLIPVLVLFFATMTAIGLQMSKVFNINPIDYLREE